MTSRPLPAFTAIILRCLLAAVTIGTLTALLLALGVLLLTGAPG